MADDNGTDDVRTPDEPAPDASPADERVDQ